MMQQNALEIQTAESTKLRKLLEESERRSAESQHHLDDVRRELQVREADFRREKQNMETQRIESVRHEQEIYQKELQDVSFRHSMVQSDRAKQDVRIRQLERELAGVKERMASQESERVASLESRIAKRYDTRSLGILVALIGVDARLRLHYQRRGDRQAAQRTQHSTQHSSRAGSQLLDD